MHRPKRKEINVRLIYGPGQVRLTFAGNQFLVHLQAATFRRFAEGGGYFLTMSGSNDEGAKVSSSYWMHPSIPLAFSYETEDDTGEPPETIVIHDKSVDALVEVMDRPLGVLWGFSGRAAQVHPV